MNIPDLSSQIYAIIMIVSHLLQIYVALNRAPKLVDSRVWLQQPQYDSVLSRALLLAETPIALPTPSMRKIEIELEKDVKPESLMYSSLSYFL